MERATHSASPGYHAVRFYENEKSLAQIVAEFLAEGLAAGHPGIVVASPSQRASIVRELVARSLDVVQLQRSNDLLLLDGKDTLAAFMPDGRLDAEAFTNIMCEAIKSVCRGRVDCTVRIYGQMVDILWQDGQQHAALRLEMLWNQLAHAQALSLMCGYAMGHFYKDVDVDDVCNHHTHVISANGKRPRVA
jgi:DcmR-like sensory protein